MSGNPQGSNPPPYGHPPPSPHRHPSGRFTNFADVPWYRRSDVNSVFVLAGWFVCPPLLWWTCIALVTGDVYYNRLDSDGALQTWSFANKVVAGILLLFNIAVFIYVLATGGAKH